MIRMERVKEWGKWMKQLLLVFFVLFLFLSLFFFPFLYLGEGKREKRRGPLLAAATISVLGDYGRTLSVILDFPMWSMSQGEDFFRHKNWDAGPTGRRLACYTTVLAPDVCFLQMSHMCMVFLYNTL